MAGSLNPRLISLDGPRKGQILDLDLDGTTFGRAPSGCIHLADSAVSRMHCTFKCVPDGSASDGGPAALFRVIDHDSHNGTFVNGLPVKERALKSGDEIRVGRSVFRFLLDAGSDSATPSVSFQDSGADMRTAVWLRSQDSVYLQREVPGEATPTDRSAHSYRSLLKISAALQAVRGQDSLAVRLLELLLESLPANRAAVVFLSDGVLQQSEAIAFGRAEGAGAKVEIRRALADHCVQARAATLWPGAAGTPCILAAPLMLSGRSVGILYLEGAPGADFDAEHLQFLTAVGVLAGAGIEDAREVDRLRADNERLQAEVRHGMVGESKPMQDVWRFVSRVAPSDSTVMILGETGTGKELVARAIHESSPRANRPFVAINCASLTESLLESELFGHERGAFTGAVAQKRGKLEIADGGTLFLDEVGELPLPLQAKLLRVLQQREFERVGGTRTIHVDLRILAATNRDLQANVATGSFRQDLFYRLNVISIRLPALRDRREDVALLAQHFLSRFAERGLRHVAGLSPEARTCLVNYDWPGNVRELENAIEAAVVLGSTPSILPEDLPETVLEAAPVASAESYRGVLQVQKRELILAALRETKGNVTAAGRRLHLHPNYLHRLIRNLGLRDEIQDLTGPGDYGRPPSAAAIR